MCKQTVTRVSLKPDKYSNTTKSKSICLSVVPGEFSCLMIRTPLSCLILLSGSCFCNDEINLRWFTLGRNIQLWTGRCAVHLIQTQTPNWTGIPRWMWMCHCQRQILRFKDEAIRLTSTETKTYLFFILLIFLCSRHYFIISILSHEQPILSLPLNKNGNFLQIIYSVILFCSDPCIIPWGRAVSGLTYKRFYCVQTTVTVLWPGIGFSNSQLTISHYHKRNGFDSQGNKTISGYHRKITKYLAALGFCFLLDEALF